MNIPRRLQSITVVLAGALAQMIACPWTHGQTTRSDETVKAAAQDFDQTIAPLLARRCLGCHSGAEPKGELDLSSRTAAFKGGSSGSVIVPGKAEKSLLWEQIHSDAMPPKHPLTAQEKRQLEQWLNQGATWGTESIDPFQYSSDARAGRDWWSLQPLKAIELAGGATKPNDLHPIDVLIQQKRHERGLAANPSANKRSLIRRLSFDLLGLPPTDEEVRQFLADESPTAYEALVDRLLQSPHYGERWARHWLDVVRFGESNGSNTMNLAITFGTIVTGSSMR